MVAKNGLTTGIETDRKCYFIMLSIVCLSSSKNGRSLAIKQGPQRFRFCDLLSTERVRCPYSNSIECLILDHTNKILHN